MSFANDLLHVFLIFINHYYHRHYHYYCYNNNNNNNNNNSVREELNRGANTAPDARLDIVARGFWERQRSAFFDVRICHPNADSYRDMDLNQIYRQHETEKKRQYASRVLEVEQATFTPLVFSTTGGMAAECKRYHSRLAE